MYKLILSVFIGSGLGGVVRYTLSQWVNRIAETHQWGNFPFGTLGVNILGCFLIGLIYGMSDSGTVEFSPATKTLLTAGFCGGLTTFSTFSHENYLLLQSHNLPMLLLYASLSLITGLLAAAAGHWLVCFSKA